MAAFCIHCGIQLPDEATFCYKCGKAVTTTATTTPRVEDKPQQPVPNEALKEALERDRPSSDKILDFDKNIGWARERARKWAEYYASGFDTSMWYRILYGGLLKYYADFGMGTELGVYFRTNKPYSHEALFKQTQMEYFIEEARKRGYIRWDNSYPPEVFAVYKADWEKLTEGERISEEELNALHFIPPDFSQLDQLARKDEQLFPKVQPIQAEAPGNISLHFTSEEAAVVVYVDAEHKGKQVTLESIDTYRIRERKPIVVIQRGQEHFYVAIFNHLPLITDEDKAGKEPIEWIKCRVKFFNLEEEIAVYKEQVAIVDWRGWEVTNVR